MIIGVAGEKKHGKDTVARYLVDNYEYSQRAFADNLKELCSVSFGPHLRDMYDENLKEKPLLIKVHTYNIVQLMKMVTQDYPVHHKDLLSIFEKLSNKGHFISIRDMLQFVGTDILRDMVDCNYHYNTVVKFFQDNNVTHGVVSDVRFPNERDLLPKDFPDAKTILVVRPSLQKNETSSHASETSLGDRNDYNYVILNDSTLEELYQKVDLIMNSLGIIKKQ